MVDDFMYRLTKFDAVESESAFLAPFDLVPARSAGNEYTVLIGPNGTGKSALLGAIARARKFQTSDFAEPSRTVAISNLVTDAFPLRKGIDASNYFYLGLRQGSNTVSTGALTASSMAALLTLPLSPVREFAWRDLCSRLQMEAPVLTARRNSRPADTSRSSGEDGLLGELELRLEESFSGGELFRRYSSKSAVRTDPLPIEEMSQRLCNVLVDFEQIFDAAEVLRRIGYALGWRFHLEYDRKPSAGQEVLFSQVLRVASATRPRSLILIDEPETALHPQWQSNLIPMLRDLLPDNLGTHILLATHSPFMVGEADSVVVSSESGFEQVHAHFGAMSIDEIVYRLFGATTTGSVLVERDLAILLQYLSGSEFAQEGLTPAVAFAVERLRARETEETDTLRLVLDEFDEAQRRLGSSE